MNTRFAAIAGTLLVGISLFVTSLISNSLNNNALTTTSEAQVACTATTTPIASQRSRRPCNPSRGDVCTDESGNVIRFVDCWWKFTVQCSNGTSKRIGTSCMTQAEADRYVSENISSICGCTAQTTTNTPPPGTTSVPATSTPIATIDPSSYPRQVLTSVPSPTRPACSGPGLGCTVDADCCGAPASAKCTAGVCQVLTPTPCVSPGVVAPGRCSTNGGVNNCCGAATCTDFEVPPPLSGNWQTYCVPANAIIPTTVPTATPIPYGSAACFYERCNKVGEPCGRQGEICHRIDGGPQSGANCSQPGVTCACVKNTSCIIFDHNDPRAEACWCVDPEYCPSSSGNIPCSLRRAREGKDDCKLFNPFLTCSNKDGFGVCDSPYCPRKDEGEAYLQTLRLEIERNPGLLDIIERNGAIESGELLRLGNTVQSPLQRFLQIFGF